MTLLAFRSRHAFNVAGLSEIVGHFGWMVFGMTPSVFKSGKGSFLGK
jgi:hypothetical protein